MIFFIFPLDLTFATGSHVGELIVWDALDWTKQASECNFWDSSVQPDARTEIKLSQSPNETSVQHLASDDEVRILKLCKLLKGANVLCFQLRCCFKQFDRLL